MNDNWKAVTIEAKLVTLPDIYWRLKEMLERRDYDVGEVGHLIGHDPALTARFLRIVNSAYFGFAANIETVNHALSILGMQQVENLVLTTSVADALGDYECEHLDVRKFWRHSIYRAITARNLAVECGLKDGERLFVAGLLCGIGHLIMYQSVPVLAQMARREANECGMDLHQAEQEVIGFDHNAVAVALMQNWCLPESLVYLVQNHLAPDPNANLALETMILHIAAKISDAFTMGLPLGEHLVRVSHYAWEATRLEIEQCLSIDLQVTEQLSDVMATLFPRRQLVAG